MRALCGSILVVVGGWAFAVAAPAPKGGDELDGTWAVMSAENDPPSAAFPRVPSG
jgi:hypothetical protein